MSGTTLIQFEDKDGKAISEVLQVPTAIEAGHLKNLINTTQDLFVNGQIIETSLENSLTQAQKEDVELVKKIRLSAEEPAAQPAVYCSSVYSGHEGPVLVTRLYKDILITAGGDRTVRLWDLLTKTQFNIVQKHTHWVLCLDVNDSYIASGGMDRVVNIYDHKGTHLKALSRHRDAVTNVRFYKDKLVSTGRDNMCVVWNMDGSMHCSWSHTKPVKALCVKDDYIFTAGGDGNIKVYKGSEYICDMKGHQAQVNTIDSDGKYVVSGDDDGKIIIWKDFQVFRRLSHKLEVMSVSIRQNVLASGSFDKTVKLWNIETGEAMATYYHVNSVYKVRVFSDLVVSCSKDKTVKMYKISKGKVVSDLVCDDEVFDFDYSDGHVVCGTRGNKVYFFN